MKYLFTNALILNPDYSVTKGDLSVSDGVIENVGTFPRPQGCEVIDCGGNLLMAGLKNCHTHSAMTLLRGYAENRPLKNWLFDSVFPFEDKLTEDDVAVGTKLAILEYLRNGITDIGEMYKFDDGYMRAVLETGFKAQGVGAVSDINGDTDKQLKIVEELFNKYNNSNRIRYVYGFHAEYTASDALLKGVANLAKSGNHLVYAHMSETKEEVVDCIRRRGTTPLRYADSLGLFDNGGTIYHAVHLTEYEIGLCAEKNISVVINAGSNLKLASGIACVSKMLEMGVNVAIGTDGAASNNGLDIFREMYLVSALAKFINKDAAAMPAEAVLDMTLKGGAKVLRQNSASLSSGSCADIILVDLRSPNMRPLTDIAANLVYCSGDKVLLTMVNGKILYNRGEYFIGEDVRNIYLTSERIVARIMKELK